MTYILIMTCGHQFVDVDFRCNITCNWDIDTTFRNEWTFVVTEYSEL